MGSSQIDAYYRNILVLNQAFSEGDAFRDQHAGLKEAAGREGERAVLWLGCNVLRTPHLAELAAAVMRLVVAELSVLGGPAHCCGAPYYLDRREAANALERTVGNFRSESAPTVVSWCPSCHTNLRSGSDRSQWGFNELHVTEFLAQRRERLEFRVPVAGRVMFHGHTGTPDRDRDADYCRTLLQAVPGLTIVAEHRDPELGLHCVPTLLASSLGATGFEAKLEALLCGAQESGADTLVTIYHSCYRELEKRLEFDGLVVENYITILARALGLPVPRNVYREFAHGGGAADAKIESCAPAKALDPDELKRAVRAEFQAAK